MTKLDFHPLAKLLPMMPTSELAELAADIKENGQQEPIVLLDGKIIDGRSRYEACGIAGVEPLTRQYDPATDGDDALAFVLTRNIFRRHLTPSQRAIAIVNLHKQQKAQKEGSAEKRILAPRGAKTSGRPRKAKSLERLAAAAGVGTTTMDRAVKVRAQAHPKSSRQLMPQKSL